MYIYIYQYIYLSLYIYLYIYMGVCVVILNTCTSYISVQFEYLNSSRKKQSLFNPATPTCPHNQGDCNNIILIFLNNNKKLPTQQNTFCKHLFTVFEVVQNFQDVKQKHSFWSINGPIHKVLFWGCSSDSTLNKWITMMNDTFSKVFYALGLKNSPQYLTVISMKTKSCATRDYSVCFACFDDAFSLQECRWSSSQLSQADDRPDWPPQSRCEANQLREESRNHFL